MNKELLLGIRENKEAFELQILEAIKDNSYQFDRSEVKFSIALGAVTNSEIQMSSFGSMLRKTDKMIILNEYLACVIFCCVDTVEGLKAASNLLNEFEAQHFSQEVFLSVINRNDCSSTHKQVRKIFSVIEFAISNGMNNIPLDEVSLEAE